MKFIHTFWSKPFLNNKFNKYETILKCTLTDYAYSAQCIHNFGEKIVLYTDKFGAELLSVIPYDDIIVLNSLDDESIHFAAQIKFEALKRCELGDVLIDGDLFLQKPSAFKIIKDNKNPIIYSFFEPYEFTLSEGMKDYYKDLFSIMSKFKYKHPYSIPTKWSECGWMNTSLMCFNNQKLLDEYINQYEYHKNILKDVDFKHLWPDIIIEQYFLTLLTKDVKKTAMIENYYYDIYANQKALDLGFTHLGKSKVIYNDYCDNLLFKSNPSLHKKIHEQINNYLRVNK